VQIKRIINADKNNINVFIISEYLTRAGFNQYQSLDPGNTPYP